MKFADIPKLTNVFGNAALVPWRDLESHFQRNAEYGTPINMDPDYQRGHVWTEEQQIKFVEHVLRGGNSGLRIYCNCPGWGHDFRGPYEIVDGKQRVTAALRFLRNELPVFGGHYYKDFEDKLNNLIGFEWSVNNLDTREKVLIWYLEMNDGLTAHTPEELNRVRGLLKKEKSQ